MNVVDWMMQRGENLFTRSGLLNFLKQLIAVVVLRVLRVDEVLDFIVWDELERVERHFVFRLSRSTPQISVFRGFCSYNRNVVSCF